MSIRYFIEISPVWLLCDDQAERELNQPIARLQQHVDRRPLNSTRPRTHSSRPCSGSAVSTGFPRLHIEGSMTETPTLKPREREILALLSDGKQARDIGSRLNISTETVRWYVKQIYAKLNASSRDEAVRARDHVRTGTSLACTASSSSTPTGVTPTPDRSPTASSPSHLVTRRSSKRGWGRGVTATVGPRKGDPRPPGRRRGVSSTGGQRPAPSGRWWACTRSGPKVTATGRRIGPGQTVAALTR